MVPSSPAEGRGAPAALTPLLEARGLTVRRMAEGSHAVVLDGADFAIAPTEIVDVGGASGVGKSTLLLALARLLPATEGTLSLGGAAADAVEPREWRRDVLYVTQTPTLLVGTVAEALLAPWHLHVRAGEDAPGADAQREALDRLGLGDIALDREAARLSVGQAARLGLARAILAAPRVLLLDEPDANLDDDATALAGEVTRAFAAAGGAVVRVRHRAGGGAPDRRVILRAGKLEEVPSDAS